MCSTVLLLVLAVVHSPREWSMAPVLTGIPVYVLAVLHSPKEWSMALVLTGIPVYVLHSLREWSMALILTGIPACTCSASSAPPGSVIMPAS